MQLLGGDLNLLNRSIQQQIPLLGDLRANNSNTTLVPRDTTLTYCSENELGAALLRRPVLTVNGSV
jgi:hypothetical protein